VHIAELAIDVPAPDLHRDAARVRELLRVKPEDGNITSVELFDDGIGMLVVVVGDNQHCGWHDSDLNMSG